LTDSIELNRLSWNERARIHARDANGFYRLDEFRRGADALFPIEAAEIGDVSGKRIIHLQCHIGCDTLSLARRGARVTGLDFSPVALDIARRLAADAGIEADFVEGTVDMAPALRPGPFDLAFTTWGTICWLPDLRDWARSIASVLAPGGELYFADAHPSFLVLEEVEGQLEATHGYQTPADAPLVAVDATTYTSDPTKLVHQTTHNWIHSLSSILGALIEAGLAPTMLHEHEALPWRAHACMRPSQDRLWRLPEGRPRMPLALSLRARKLG